MTDLDTLVLRGMFLADQLAGRNQRARRRSEQIARRYAHHSARLARSEQ